MSVVAAVIIILTKTFAMRAYAPCSTACVHSTTQLSSGWALPTHEADRLETDAALLQSMCMTKKVSVWAANLS